MRILLVDDDRTLREGCASVLQIDGYAVTTTGRGDEAIDLLKRRKFDIVLVDLYLTPVTGMDILRGALTAHRETIVIVMTGNPSVATSIEALRAGAWDYLPKPFSAQHMQILLGRASHAVAVARETREFRDADQAEQHGNSDRITLLGVSPAFRQAVELARKVAATDASVMISGESGTGKELIAQFIHRHSRRASRKLVPINCAALPEPLLESEMFGHRKGAFTGADRDKAGLLETANGGTLFLDELTEMSHALQAKLLRVLQDGVVRRVGSEQQDAVVDVRFISATNREPQEAVNAGMLARGSVLPSARRADQAAAAPQAARGHPAPGEPFPRALLGAAPPGGRRAAEAHGRVHRVPPRAPVARQRARAAERDRARRRDRRAGAADPAGGHPGVRRRGRRTAATDGGAGGDHE